MLKMIKRARLRLRQLVKNEKAATAIEYALISSLIAIAIMGAVQGVGNALKVSFNTISASVAAAP